MKDLKTFILESSEETDVVRFIEQLVKSLSSKLVPGDSFVDQDKNAEIIADAIKDAIADGKFPMDGGDYNDAVYVQTLAEYYEDHKSDYSSKNDCDAKAGDIIIINQDTNKEYHFDLKVGEKYLGAVSMGSLVNFYDFGWYILVNASNGKVKMVSHRAVDQAVRENPELIRPQTNNKRSYKVNFENVTYKSEDFIGGISLEKL